MSSSKRDLIETIVGRQASDGDGVRLMRIFGGQHAERFDPFLMLDEFGSDEAADYVGGFPSHPHRGFETVTYMLDGRMLHEDHLGNRGLLEPGGVQWMTAGRGIIHSEMPQQESGLMRGFQLWVNLPAAEKMLPAEYRDIAAADVPFAALRGGGRIKMIAGALTVEGQQLSGPIQGKTTQPLYADVQVESGQRITLPVPDSLTALLYVYEGNVTVNGQRSEARLSKGELGRLDSGDIIELAGGEHGAKVLLIAGKPLREPIVQYGPFVMNRREEIEQALRDFREGRFGA